MSNINEAAKKTASPSENPMKTVETKPLPTKMVFFSAKDKEQKAPNSTSNNN